MLRRNKVGHAHERNALSHTIELDAHDRDVHATEVFCRNRLRTMVKKKGTPWDWGITLGSSHGEHLKEAARVEGSSHKEHLKGATRVLGSFHRDHLRENITPVGARRLGSSHGDHLKEATRVHGLSHGEDLKEVARVLGSSHGEHLKGTVRVLGSSHGDHQRENITLVGSYAARGRGLSRVSRPRHDIII